jgi:non-heme Fe2+,alpha-ketoglutarate-dependent halogenase
VVDYPNSTVMTSIDGCHPSSQVTRRGEECRQRGFGFAVDILKREDANACLSMFERYEERLGGKPLSGDDRFKLHLLLPWVWALVHNERIVQLACRSLNTVDVWCWSSDVNVKERRSDAYFPWHQDSTYAGISPVHTAVTVWLALTPSNEASGCLQCIPNSQGRQLEHVEGHVQDSSNALSKQQEIVDFPDTIHPGQAVSMILEAGQASVHDFWTVHSSRPNTSEHRRVGLALRFVSAHAHKTGCRESATLVSGNGHGLFDEEIAPTEELGQAERQRHKQAMAKEKSNYLPDGSAYR